MNRKYSATQNKDDQQALVLSIGIVDYLQQCDERFQLILNNIKPTNYHGRNTNTMHVHNATEKLPTIHLQI
jgi:hypothetical protein